MRSFFKICNALLIHTDTKIKYFCESFLQKHLHVISGQLFFMQT